MEQVPETVPAPITTKFEVFINHRGPDVKTNIASLIYHRLDNSGYKVFLDKNALNPGDDISPAIQDAIESASVHVAIFSERYAESTWCLEELHLMLKSFKEKRSRIITVFSDVQPHDLRYIDKGCYKNMFENHKQKGRFSKKDLKKWKRALYKASHISGLLFKTKDKTKESDYGDFLEDVAKAVLNLVASKSEPLKVAKYPVGLDQAAEDFRSKIPKPNPSKATVIVVIAGMVGVGKSTLAKHLFNQMKPSEFSSSCFLNDVRNGDLPSLQKSLFHDLFGNNYVQSVPHIKEAKRLLRNRSVFVVLDDVDGVKEMAKIESLLDMVAMASGSLIMITSRNKGLLKQTSAKLDNVTTLVYDVKPLKEEHARELFCVHSFAQSTPPEEFKDLVALSLQICGGFPLFLEILGGIFVDRPPIEDWKKKLEKFSIIPPKDIMDQLEGIYDSLDTKEKNLFLDIGCFLVGEEKELATRVLEGLYDNAGIYIEEYFESLRRKYLVDYKIECIKREDLMIALSDSCRNLEMIAMPDPLWKLARDMARNFFGPTQARNFFGPTQALRLSSEKDIEEVSKTTSNNQIRGIRFSKQPTFREGIRVNSDGIRLFVAEGRVDLSSFFDSWNISGELVWLRLGNLSYFHFPPSISLQTLRVLELVGSEDSVEHFFKNFNHDAGRRELNTVDAGASTSMGRLSSSIFRFWPNGSSIFSNWKRQTLFQYLESRVTGMETLTNLELKNITSLRSLPIDFSQLQNLTQLDLSGCVNLTALPSLSNLVNLEFLNINGCSNLEILNVEGLTSLKEIKAEACWNLKIDGLESAGMVELSRHFNRR